MIIVKNVEASLPKFFEILPRLLTNLLGSRIHPRSYTSTAWAPRSYISTAWAPRSYTSTAWAYVF